MSNCVWCNKKVKNGKYCRVAKGYKNCARLHRIAQVNAGELPPQDSMGMTARKTNIPEKCEARPVCLCYGKCFGNGFIDHKVCTWKDPVKDKKQPGSKAIDPTVYR